MTDQRSRAIYYISSRSDYIAPFYFDSRYDYALPIAKLDVHGTTWDALHSFCLATTNCFLIHLVERDRPTTCVSSEL